VFSSSSSIFLHTVLAFERYLAVCHPQLVYSTAKKPTQTRKNMAGHTNKNNSAADIAIRKKVEVIFEIPFQFLWSDLDVILGFCLYLACGVVLSGYQHSKMAGIGADNCKDG